MSTSQALPLDNICCRCMMNQDFVYCRSVLAMFTPIGGPFFLRCECKKRRDEETRFSSDIGSSRYSIECSKCLRFLGRQVYHPDVDRGDPKILMDVEDNLVAHVGPSEIDLDATVEPVLLDEGCNLHVVTHRRDIAR